MNKTLREIVLVFGIIAISICLILSSVIYPIVRKGLQEPTATPVSKMVMVNMTQHVWSNLQIVKNDSFRCPPTRSEYDSTANEIVVIFQDDTQITISANNSGRAAISLEPEEIMQAQGLRQSLHDFKLKEGEILVISLENYQYVKVFLCGSTVFLVGPKF